MNRIVIAVTFVIGLVAVLWAGWGFVGTSSLALAMTGAIAAAYLLGSWELKQFRAATASLAGALADLAQPVSDIDAWLDRVHSGIRGAVRLRIEGERVALPGPALTPYLVGLLVMLGMLGTFLGMVVTFKGAVFALEGSSDLAAIRSALAAPIKGLGLSFGTSVAGVAASAMLGLMSAISRRERLEVVRLLESRMATVLRPFSRAYQRQESFKALQAQSQAMPMVVDRLQTLVEGLERRSEQLNQQLLDQQQRFHGDASAAYGELARSVGQSLKDSLAQGARMAGESIRPVVESAMSEMAQQSQRTHERLVEVTQAQLHGVSSRWDDTARTVSATWTAALENHAQTSAALVSGLDRALNDFTHVFEQRAAGLLGAVEHSMAQAQAEQARLDAQRQEAWARRLQSMSAALVEEWQHAGAQTMAQQAATCQTLESTASVWRSELHALRQEEAERGQVAVARLDDLQTAVAGHLATLGAALEAPMTRLMQTASEAPQAAAQVIAQLRQEMTRLSERDNLALEERSAMMAQLSALLAAIQQTANQQRTAVESLVASATAVLHEASGRFAGLLDAQAGQVEGVAVQVAASAVELSSLGESFNQGVGVFSQTQEKLIDSLHRMEQAMAQSVSRSDEQLAYYVAQAREVIDLSMAAQQGIVEDLRRLHDRSATLAREDAQ